MILKDLKQSTDTGSCFGSFFAVTNFFICIFCFLYGLIKLC